MFAISILVFVLGVYDVNAQNKPQAHDPRIGQKESLALIGMDPVDVSYVTDYATHSTGVLLVPSSGPLEGKGGLYTNLSVPAGTLVDFPKGAKVEPFHFTAPNGEEADAVKVTLQPSTKAIVNACGNGHKPRVSMIMKLIGAAEESVKTAIALIDYEGIRRAAREAFEAAPPSAETLPQPTIETGNWYTTWWDRHPVWASVTHGVLLGIADCGFKLEPCVSKKKGPNVTTLPETP
ncbi:MAG TPA: hypothetical protein VJH06_01270 [Candidatus Paceibacterota bacterium]